MTMQKDKGLADLAQRIDRKKTAKKNFMLNGKSFDFYHFL